MLSMRIPVSPAPTTKAVLGAEGGKGPRGAPENGNRIFNPPLESL